MTANPPERQLITGGTGQTVILRSSEELASGGEGTVYLPSQFPNLAAKIYHNPSDNISAKLRLMIANPPRVPRSEEGRIAIAWPEDILLEPGRPDRVAGFLMRLVSGRPIIQYYSPRLRPKTAPHFTYEHLLVAARNLAEAVDVFHGQRNIIGDINESNVLVTENASVALIDTDSFQVIDRRNGSIYRSPVGKPEYTPAELQGHRFDSTDRNSDHDLFGLAVIIYQVLMEGFHPFTGAYTGSGDPPQLEDRIASGQFPHSRERTVSLNPSPIAPRWDALQPRLQQEFLQCFDIGHNSPETRPTAHEWAQTLEDAMGSLIVCTSNGQHRYFDHLPDCPWCDRARRMGGRDPFASLPRGVQNISPSFQPYQTLSSTPPSSSSVPPTQTPSPHSRQSNSGDNNGARSTRRRSRGLDSA